MSKTAFLGLFLVIFSNSMLQAQAEFMPVGAELNISYGYYRGKGSFILTSEKDTLCGGSPCRKITEINAYGQSSFFVKQVKDSIFHWDTNSQKFWFVFRTNMNVGDTLLVSNEIRLIADSAREENSMRLTYCTAECVDKTLRSGNRRVVIIFDRLGLAEIYNSYFYSCMYMQNTDLPRYYFHCYRDKQISFSNNPETCAFGNASINKDKITVYPNPTQSGINLTAGDDVLIRKCELIDAMGRSIQKLHFDDVPSAFYLFSEMQSGAYLLKIETSTGDIVRKKIIIHH